MVSLLLFVVNQLILKFQHQLQFITNQPKNINKLQQLIINQLKLQLTTNQLKLQLTTNQLKLKFTINQLNIQRLLLQLTNTNKLQLTINHNTQNLLLQL